MQLQEHQAWALSALPSSYFDVLGTLGPAVSAEIDGEIIACAGIAIQGLGVGTLWAFVSRGAGPYFVRLDRCVRRLIDITPLRRLEASVEVGFRPGCRWLKLLHFRFEGRMRKFAPNGADHWRYAKVT